MQRNFFSFFALFKKGEKKCLVLQIILYHEKRSGTAEIKFIQRAKKAFFFVEIVRKN